jgi:hypothetical protein
MSLAPAIRAELRKVTTTRTILGLAVAAALLPNLGSLGPLLAIGGPGGADVSTPEAIRQSINVAFTASIFAVVLGVLIATTEFRHRTLTQTLVMAPDRWRLVAAKAVVAFALGLGFGLIGVIVATGVGVAILDSKGVSVPLTDPDYLRMYAGSILLGGMSGLWGLAIGFLVRNQVGAIFVAVVYTVFVEGPLIAVYQNVGEWLPGGAQASMVGDLSLQTLPQLAGVALFAAYVAALTYISGTRLRRADVS